MKINKNTNRSGKWVSANDVLKSDPINGVGIPSQFSETCEALEFHLMKARGRI